MNRNPPKILASLSVRDSSRSSIEWVQVLGPLLLSWPLVALLIVLSFRGPLFRALDRFADSEGSKAEIGPLKFEMGHPVLPPKYRAQTVDEEREIIDLSATIGQIRDTGPEATTAGVAIAYALQAAVKNALGRDVSVSARGIYELARNYDEWRGTDYAGTSVRGGLKAVQQVGVYSEHEWPYGTRQPIAGAKPTYRISHYSEVHGVEQILQALRNKQVVIATVDVTGDFDKPDAHGRVTIKLPINTLGGKAIAIVGYDSASAEFKFANDWGSTWGADGFGLIKDTDLARIMMDGYIVEL